MGISEKGYTHWKGEFKSKQLLWWPIARTGIKLTFRKKLFKFFFFSSIIPAVVYAGGIYIAERLEDFQPMLRGSKTILQINPGYFKSYFTNEFLLFMMIMILVFSGAGLISDDLRYNSLQLYFSRPLRKIDYFFGKASILIFFLLLITLIPGLAFILIKLIFSGRFQFLISYPWLILSVIGYSFIIATFFTFYTLLLSSMSKDRRYVTILIIAVYLFSDVLFGVFYGFLKSPYTALLSLKVNVQQVGAAIFFQKPRYDIPLFYSFFILALICFVAVIILKRKIRGVEVIK